ncbi:hypothetical protein F5883DRAFT_513900 [Diaporthe sp. PMI_573]|nr:hypothetical protein F5883DRAFT_513900 [Diaporthaceae sp. PMI_573]
MGNCLPVSRAPGNNGHDGALELKQTLSEAMNTPAIQYPTDDTMLVKAWVSEKKRGSKHHFKPLRPEDEHKALEVINRHLPPRDQIEIPHPSPAVPGTDAYSRLILFPESHLPLPPRCWNRRERREAAKTHGSLNTATPAKTLAKKQFRRRRYPDGGQGRGAGMDE